ncbi:MAG: DUF6470 family protein [Tepidanaerobacteraceae bacterium]|nr:hypothetical protein [Thermoanaerobacterales bacterium]
MLNYNLDISFDYGKIGINTYKGHFAIKTAIQESYKLETQSPNMSTTKYTFPIIDDIDISHCRTDMGYPQLFVASSIWRDNAKYHVLKYIGEKAAIGDDFADVRKEVSIAEVVESESFKDPPEINVDAVPKTPPKITFRFGEYKSKVDRGRVNVRVSDEPVTMHYEKAKVNIFMEKNPYINIKAVPVGKNIDEIT